MTSWQAKRYYYPPNSSINKFIKYCVDSKKLFQKEKILKRRNQK